MEPTWALLGYDYYDPAVVHAPHNNREYLSSYPTTTNSAGFTVDSRAVPSPVCRSRFANPEHVPTPVTEANQNSASKSGVLFA